VADLVDQLIGGEIPLLCQTSAGMLTTSAERPAALLCGSFNPLHDGHLRLAECAARRLGRPVAFELGVVNADKPPLDAAEVRRRLMQFVGCGDLWLTREPNFVGKSALFPDTVFVVGVDTAVRIVDPRFYADTDATMRAALEALVHRHCCFLIAGRVDATGQFQSPDERRWPAEFQQLFLCLSEAEFRSDLSSTAQRLLVPE